MLSLVDITKYLDDEVVLSDINLQFNKGEIFGLLGCNGSGKTTLLRLIMQLLIPEKGDILYNQESIIKCPTLKQKIQFMPVRNSFFEKYNYNELTQILKSIYPQFDISYANELMNRYSLPENKKYRELSTGQKKQLSLIVAFASRPEVLLLDEPTDGIDAVTRHDLLQLLIDEVADREITVIITSHRLEDIERICNRIGFLENNQLSEVFDLDELKEQYVKIQAVFDDDISLKIREKKIPILDHAGIFYTLLLPKSDIEGRSWLKSLQPKVWNELSVNLEEVFIAKFGGKRRW
ncbi:ABC transporter ATP-binding protein [Bacillus salitolerans]|uniref:ABC transporter ATP-binding protein n=1 Tax=Bacillus salitolerans TaxID=1437434 RepID=A0ABW4LK29_9BACI